MISEELIPKIENAFGFPLYEWQKEYLIGNPFEKPKDRGSGRTFAYILNLLLSDEKPIKVRGIRPPYETELWHMNDESHGLSYKVWFFNECMRMNRILAENGIKTRIV